MKRTIIASLMGLSTVAQAKQPNQPILIDDHKLQMIARAYNFRYMGQELLDAGIIVPMNSVGQYTVDLTQLKSSAARAEREKDNEVIQILKEIIGDKSKVEMMEEHGMKDSVQDFAMENKASFLKPTV